MYWLSNPGLKKWKNRSGGSHNGMGSKGEPVLAILDVAKKDSQNWQKERGEEASAGKQAAQGNGGTGEGQGKV